MKFWKDPLQREQFKSRAEKLTRSICDSYESPRSGDIRQQRARDSVQDRAKQIVNTWKRGKSFKQLIENLRPVLPPNASAPVFGVLDTPQKIKTASREARRAVHPNVMRRYNPTALQKKIADYAFNALQEAYDRVFPN